MTGWIILGRYGDRVSSMVESSMYFNATASFATSGVLVPLGIYCLSKVQDTAPGSDLLAAFPLLFGIQQGFEGIVWLALDGQQVIDAHLMALFYLFFAYFLWPFFAELISVYVAYLLHRVAGEEQHKAAYAPGVMSPDYVDMS